MRLFAIGEEGKFTRYAELDFTKENREAMLEEWLEGNPDHVLEEGKLLLIGRQVATNLGSVVDLLGIDRDGELVIVELKRGRTPRETLAQILEYASFGEELTYDDLEQILRDYDGRQDLSLADHHREYFNLGDAEAVAFNKEQRLVIVGQSISKDIKQTSTYLRRRGGIEVSCIEFKYFKTKSGEQIISTDVVVGADDDIGRPTKVDKGTFLRSLDQDGQGFFRELLEYAEEAGMPIHWGTKGFSVNVDVEGMHVPLLYGYPPDSLYGQTVYTAMIDIRRKVEQPASTVEKYRERVAGLGPFQPAGNEMKWLVTGRVDDGVKGSLFAILLSVAEEIKATGLMQ